MNGLNYIDIYNEKIQIILQLLWKMIQHYEWNQDYEKGSIKKDIYSFITNLTKEFIEFNDFSTLNLALGGIFACILSHLNSNLLNLSEELQKIKESSDYSKELLIKVQDLAYKNMEIPPLLDIDSIISTPDEKSLILYSFYFYEKQKNKEKTPNTPILKNEEIKEVEAPKIPKASINNQQIEEILNISKILQTNMLQILKQNEDLKEIKDSLSFINHELLEQNGKLKKVEENLTTEIEIMRQKHNEELTLIRLQNEQIKLQNEQNSLSIQKMKEQNETIKLKNEEILELEKLLQKKTDIEEKKENVVSNNTIETIIDDETSHDTDDNDIELYIPKTIREMLRSGTGIQQFIKFINEEDIFSKLIDLFKTTEYIQEILFQDPEYHNLFETLYHNLMNLNPKLNIDIFSKNLNTFDKLNFEIEKLLEEKFKMFIYSPIWNEIITKSKKEDLKKTFWKLVPFEKKEVLQLIAFEEVIKTPNLLNTFKRFCEGENIIYDLEIYLLIQTFRDKLILILLKDLKLNVLIENLNKIHLINFKKITNYNEIKIIFSIEEEIINSLEKKFIEFQNVTKWEDVLKNDPLNDSEKPKRKLSSFFPKKSQINNISKPFESPTIMLSPRKLTRKLTRFEETIEVIKKGDLDQLKNVELDENEFISSHPVSGNTLLHESVLCSNYKITEFLIQKGIDVSCKDKSDRTPLHLACANKNREICLLLLSNKAKVNIRDNSGVYPLLICLKRKNYEIANDLILFQADINFKRENGCTLLHDMVINEDLEGTKWALNQNNVKLNTKDLNGFTPLLRASSSKNPFVLQELLLRGADFEVKDNHGRNIFHIMILSKNIDNLKLFLGMKIDELKKYSKLPNEQMLPKQRTSLHLAVESKNFKLVGTLVSIYVKLNLEMNIKDLNKQSPLDLSIEMADKCTNLPTNNHSQIDIKDLENIVKIKQFLSKYFK